MFYHLPLSVAGKRFYKAENAGALWLEASCGGCYYAGSCGVDGPVLEQVRGLGPITTFIQIGAGAVVYFLVLLVMRDPFLYQYLGKYTGG